MLPTAVKIRLNIFFDLWENEVTEELSACLRLDRTFLFSTILGFSNLSKLSNNFDYNDKSYGQSNVAKADYSI